MQFNWEYHSPLAVKDSGLAPGMVDPYRFGVVFGSGRMTCHPGELAAAAEVCRAEGGIDVSKWGQKALAEIAPLWLLRQMPNMFSGQPRFDRPQCLWSQ